MTFSAKLTLANQSSSIILPEPLLLDVELAYPKTYIPDQDSIIDSLTLAKDIDQPSPFALIESQEENLFSNNQIHQHLHYSLEPLLAGNHILSLDEGLFLPIDASLPSIPMKSNSIAIHIILPEKKELDLTTLVPPPLDLSGKTPIELNTALRSFLKEDQSSYNQHIFAMKEVIWQPLLVLLLLGLMTFILRKILKKHPQTIQQTPLEVIAFNEAKGLLQKLKEQPKLDPQCVESYIVAISNSVRYHFEQELGTKVSTQTTQEFLKSLKENEKMDPLKKKELISFLDQVDQIKFAHYQPTLEECLEAYNRAQAFMN